MLLAQLLFFVAVLPALYAFLFGSGLRINSPKHTARKCASAPSQFDASFSPRPGFPRPQKFRPNKINVPSEPANSSIAPQTPGIVRKGNRQRPSSPTTNQENQVNQAQFSRPTTPFKNPKWSRSASPVAPRVEEITRLASSYNGELQDGQWHGQGTVVFVDGSKYEGSFERGKKHGTGKETSAAGLVLEGVFQHNQAFNASGTHVALDGTVTEGTWVNGKLEGSATVHYPALDKGVQAVFEQGRIVNGSGTFRVPEGTVFEGQWQDGKFVGQGKVIFRDITFEGTFVNGSLHGQGSENQTNGARFVGFYDNWKRVNGTMYFRDGHVYSGEFKLSEFHGQGQLNYTNGDSYSGNFQYGRRHDYGVMVYASGGRYSGNWVNGNCTGNATYEKGSFRYDGWYNNNTRDGYGVIHFSDGGKYEGMVLEKQHGAGKHTSAYGEVFEGIFRNGNKVSGSGTFRERLNVSYSGVWEGGFNEGNTTVRYPDGGVFVGIYQRGKANGLGTKVYGDGSVYTGMWAGGMRHGRGVMKHSSGVVEEGRFVADDYVPDEEVHEGESDVVSEVVVVDLEKAVNEAVNEMVHEAVRDMEDELTGEMVSESASVGDGGALIADLTDGEVVITL